VLLLDKPEGVSSFQALRPLKRLFPKTKIGHAGTLDPMASGLLLIGIGTGTRLLEYLEGLPKTYTFTARFGYVSDSYDMEGAVEPFTGLPSGRPAAIPPDDIPPEYVPATDLDGPAVARALEAFRGRIRQTPPVYSAIKIGSERACDRVRTGETVVLRAREVTVQALKMTSFFPGALPKADVAPAAGASASDAALTAPSAAMEMTCSKGTYVRSLVHDLGLALGAGAVTDKIRRTAIGPYRVENAHSPDSLEAGMALLPLEPAVSHLPAGLVAADQIPRLLMGQSVPAAISTEAPETGDFRAMDASGRL